MMKNCEDSNVESLDDSDQEPLGDQETIIFGKNSLRVPIKNPWRNLILRILSGILWGLWRSIFNLD